MRLGIVLLLLMGSGLAQTPTYPKTHQISFADESMHILATCDEDANGVVTACEMKPGVSLMDLLNVSLQSNKSCWEYHEMILKDIRKTLHTADTRNTKRRAK